MFKKESKNQPWIKNHQMLKEKLEKKNYKEEIANWINERKSPYTQNVTQAKSQKYSTK